MSVHTQNQLVSSNSVFISCSAPIRQLITVVQRRFHSCLTDLQQTDLQIKLNPSRSNQEHVNDLENLSFMTENFIKRIKSAVDILLDQNREWLNIQKALPSDQLTHEIDLYNQWSSQSGSFLEDICTGNETICNLESKLAEFKSIISQIRKSEHSVQPPQTTPLFSAGLSQTMLNDSHLSIHLPKLQLPLYHGDPLKWTEFWDSFESAVHSQTIPSVQKFNYLLSILKGSAYKSIEGISVTNSNYLVALEILKKRFGDPNVIKRYLYAELRKIPSSSNRTFELRQTLEAIERVTRQLSSLKENLNQPTLIMLILEKLPNAILIELGKLKTDSCWEMNNLLENLNKIIIVREEAFQISSTLGARENDPRAQNRIPLQTHQVTNQEVEDGYQSFVVAKGRNQKDHKIQCAFCQEEHFSDQCKKYETIQSRKDKIQEKKLCFRCLRSGHQSTQCSANRPCFYCQGNHNRALCLKNQPSKFAIPVQNMNAETHLIYGPSEINRSDPSTSYKDNIITANNISTNPTPKSSRIALMLCEVEVVNFKEKSCPLRAYAFFDSGSQKTYISNRLSSQLNLDSSANEILKINTFGSNTSKQINSTPVSFGIILKDGTCKEIHASSVETLTGRLITPLLKEEDIWEIEINNLDGVEKHLENLISSGKIIPDILIGMDYFWDFINTESIYPLPSGLHLINTTVGPIFSGNQTDPWNHTSKYNVVQSNHSNDEVSFEAAEPTENVRESMDLATFWDLETIGIKDDPEIKDDDLALEKFNLSIKFKDNRYCVKWPWKSDQIDLRDNYALCLGRLKSLSKRLLSDPHMLEKYNQVIEDQLSKNIIEKVNIETSSLKHYLPHHAVITPHKSTTKIRVVYDASAKITKKDKSLNECLYRGPIMLPDLCGLLIRFRIFPIAITADIEKAFLQVVLQEEDRDVTRFLCFKNPTVPSVDNNLQIYRFCRVPFGIISSPFILNATIKYHLAKSGSIIASNLSKNLYVDNLIIGAKDLEEASKIYQESKQIFKQASMNLREWTSNSTEFNTKVDPNDRGNKSEVKVLGISWNTLNDVIKLSVPVHEQQSSIVTKRLILKQVAQIFDPLGFLSPILLPGKLFIQKMWKLGLSWDDPLPENLKTEYDQILLNWKSVTHFFISRFVSLNSLISSVQHHLIAFTDASQSAYAVVVYLKSEYADGSSNVNIIFAKSRLAPSKKITIPRLELLGAVIGLRALNFIIGQISIPISSKFLFLDSEIVMHWIRTAKPQPVFIENRIRLFKEDINVQVNHVPGVENPADLATRGISSTELEISNVWWFGPKWLKEPQENWPKTNYETSYLSFSQESNVLSSGVSHHTTDEVQEPKIVFNLKRFSNLKRALKVTSYVNRFIKVAVWDKLADNHQLKNQHRRLKIFFSEIKSHGPFSANELILAEITLIKESQRLFHHQFLNEENPREVKLKHLGIRKDKNGILRCFGRLQNAIDLSEDSKFPILISGKSDLARLIILSKHQSVMHFGINHTLSEIRREFWITKGRSAVQKVIRNCFICRKYHSGPYQLPKMPAYPKERVVKSRPFQFTGLDYLGPFWIKNTEKVKIWICLFTCLSTRAIHLEYIIDLSTQTFLNCMRRFISRRGKPDKIISDNASQFKLSNQVLDQVWESIQMNENVITYFSILKIKWHFIIEYSPWQGGFYERLVGIVKQAIKKSVGKQILSFDNFLTLLTEVEAVINSRPLTYPEDDVDVPRVLRPLDFINPHAEIGIPSIDYNQNFDPEKEEIDERFLIRTDLSTTQKLISYWKKSQETLNHFWKLWHDNYLLNLRERTPMFHRSPRIRTVTEPKENEIVLIKDENLPRGFWKLGRLLKINHSSSDDHIRSAQVELANKTVLNRPINLLYPLEIRSSEQSSDEIQTEVHAMQHSKCFTLSIPSTLITLLLLLMIFPNFSVQYTAHSYECKVFNSKNIIYSQNCLKSGLVIQQSEGQDLCYSKISCPSGHLSVSGRCGHKCSCPKWADDCSFYRGPLPAIIGNKQSILALADPNICSFKPDPNCDSKTVHTTIHQIQLFDNTVYFVDNLQLAFISTPRENFSCVGEGLTIGSPEYCSIYHCSKHGKKFCFFDQHDITKFVNEEGEIPIKSWGTVPITIYPHKSSKLGSNSTVCINCSVSCIQGGLRLTLDQSVGFLDVCSKPFCYQVHHPKLEEVILFPKESIIKPHEFDIKIWKEGFNVKDMTIHCPASVFCEMITCYLCSEILYNPQCAPKFSLFLSIISIYFGLAMCYMFIKILKSVFEIFRISVKILHKFLTIPHVVLKIMKRLINKCRLMYAEKSDHNATSDTSIGFKFQPSSHKYSLAIMVLMASIVNPCAEVTPITVSTSSCSNSKNGSIDCKISDMLRLSLVPQGQDRCVTILSESNEPLGTITLQVRKISLQCGVKNEYYTRSFSMHVQSSKRCYLRGSCFGEKCASISISSFIEELDGEANQHPGFTYCAESCGCAACGCITCSSACLFYRTYAKPTSDNIFEVFSCPVWSFKVSVRVDIIFQNSSFWHEFDLKPGVSKTWRNLKFNIPSIANPPLPILGSQFLTDNQRTIMIKASASGQPIAGTIGQLQCSSRDAAINFDCYLPHDICNCQMQESRASCSCPEQIIEPLFQKREYMIPMIMEGLSITGSGSNIEAEYNNIASLEVQLAMEGFHLQSTTSKNECKIKFIELSGCYNCLSGAKLIYTCLTDFDQALAHVTCSNTFFSTICTPTESIYASVLNFNHALINETCRVSCPAKITEFLIQGQLSFVSKERINNISNVISIVNETKMDSELDLKFALSSIIYSNDLITVIICAITIFLFLPLITCCVPRLLLHFKSIQQVPMQHHKQF